MQIGDRGSREIAEASKRAVFPVWRDSRHSRCKMGLAVERWTEVMTIGGEAVFRSLLAGVLGNGVHSMSATANNCRDAFRTLGRTALTRLVGVADRGVWQWGTMERR